jgi:hypothetical protein
MPQVAVMASGAAQKQTREEEPKSYRKKQKIVVGVNGEISGAPLDLGAAGDSNVTAIEFDTSALDWYQSNLENYEATLTFFHGGSTYYTYSFDGKLFSVPSDSGFSGPASLKVPNLTINTYGSKTNTINTQVIKHEGYGGWT